MVSICTLVLTFNVFIAEPPGFQVDLFGVYWLRVYKRFAMKLAFSNTRKLTRIEAQAIKEVLLERNRITQEVGEASS